MALDTELRIESASFAAKAVLRFKACLSPAPKTVQGERTVEYSNQKETLEITMPVLCPTNKLIVKNSYLPTVLDLKLHYNEKCICLDTKFLLFFVFKAQFDNTFVINDHH